MKEEYTDIKIKEDLLGSLSEKEKELALKILQEFGEQGNSSTYNDLIFDDYKEIPVDIETFLTDDKYLGKPWKDSYGKSKVYPFWLDVLKEIFPNNIDTAYDTLLESGARGLGKAQPLDSLVLTKSGYKKMKDIHLDDEVFGDDGKLHKVVGVFPQGIKPVCKVTFNDRTSTLCCDEHLWTVYVKTKRDWQTLTTKELIDSGVSKFREDLHSDNLKYKIPVTEPIQFEHQDVIIPAYTLGVLIGDGHISSSCMFTSFDNEIIDSINNELPETMEIHCLDDNRRCYSIVNKNKSFKNINTYYNYLRNINLNVSSPNKFIPNEYLLNDVDTRISLLQGLLDTDGYINKTGNISYSTISEQLCKDVVFLVQSLGGICKVNEKIPFYYDKNRNKKYCNKCYLINIKLPNSICPFKLSRKKDRMSDKVFKPSRYIKSIEYVEPQECQCILLDYDRHLYLTNDFIVTHNSEVACGAVCAYLMYRVMCLKNPLEYYHMKLTEKITFAFMNIKLELSEAIAVDKFQKTIQMSPWFMSKGKMTQRNNQPYWNPPDPIEIIIGSQADDVIGRPIFFAFFDEVSFMKNKDVEEQKKKALNMIDTAIGGMKTRFVHKGKNPTLLVVASSKKSEQSFMESYIRQLKETQGDNTYIVDEPVWKVKPKGTYSEETFFIGLGNKFLDSIVIPDSDRDKIKEYEAKGYQIIEAPIDFRAKALEDLDRALCDYAGISSFTSNKFLSAERLSDVVSDEIHNPMPDKITVGNGKNDDVQYSDFFKLDLLDKKYMNKPLFIHLDMSISGDKTGIAGVWIIGKKPTSDGNSGKDLFFQPAFSFSVEAPKGRQISFEKNRNFIRWLRDQGFRVRSITSDTFQSYDLQQQLKAEGFNCDILSVDRVETTPGEKGGVCRPYQYIKNTIYENRIRLYKTELLYNEYVQLEKNNDTGKVDHPPKGSKDQADAMTGAVYNASKYADEFAHDYGEDFEIILKTNEKSTSNDIRQMTVDFEEELKKMGPNLGKPIGQSEEDKNKQTVYNPYSDVLIW